MKTLNAVSPNIIEKVPEGFGGKASFTIAIRLFTFVPSVLMALVISLQ